MAADSGSGYVQAGDDGRTFGQMIEGTEAPYDVVVFFGSREGHGSGRRRPGCG